MAPNTDASVELVEAQLKDVVQNLYNLIVQPFDHRGTPTQEAMKREIASLVQNLVKLSQTAPHVRIDIPPEVTEYVENSRNPDVFTREFVEMVQRMNQMLKGRTDGMRLMRDTLVMDILRGIPALKNDLQKVVESTGDTIPELSAANSVAS